MDYEIILSPKAIEDLESIIAYIAKDDLVVAKRFGKILAAEIRKLETLPNAGSIVQEFQKENIRQLVKKPYRIIYRIDYDKNRISVSRFWHSSRDNLTL